MDAIGIDLSGPCWKTAHLRKGLSGIIPIKQLSLESEVSERFEALKAYMKEHRLAPDIALALPQRDCLVKVLSQPSGDRKALSGSASPQPSSSIVTMDGKKPADSNMAVIKSTYRIDLPHNSLGLYPVVTELTPEDTCLTGLEYGKEAISVDGVSQKASGLFMKLSRSGFAEEINYDGPVVRGQDGRERFRIKFKPSGGQGNADNRLDFARHRRPHS